MGTAHLFMTIPMNARTRFILCISLFALFAGSALADRLYLVDGMQIPGTAVAVSATSVQFKTTDGVTHTYPRSSVQWINFGQTPAAPTSPSGTAGDSSTNSPAATLASNGAQGQTAAPSNTGSNVPQAQAQAALAFHNAKRQAVGVGPLQWSTTLAAAAQSWANHLARDENCNLVHTQNNTYGENLFGGSGMAYTALDAAEDWYSEIAKYHYGVLASANFAPTGHYTQMVWRNTTQVGMGQATCPGGAIVIVAEYNPPGNYIGQKPY